MSIELNELYQELILDHARHPHHFGEIILPTHKAVGINPICGDEITLTLLIEGNTIKDIQCKTDGCALSKASGSMMADLICGKSIDEANALKTEFLGMLLHQHPLSHSLDKLNVFSNVNQFPMRVKCVTLAWHAFKAAIDKHVSPVSTE